LPAESIADIARGVGIPAESSADVSSALAEIGRYALASPPRILITGSLYLAGAVLSANGTPPT
jgi:dihydrofolate synthase/folylpolyglutamate synthase